MVPLTGPDGLLQTLQFIMPDGGKLFLSGLPKKAGFFVVGDPSEIICLAEGFATAASLHEAIWYQAVAAADAGNLLGVAQAIRKRQPHNTIVVYADDDHRTPGNPGMTKAQAAARAICGFLAVPDFGPDRQENATDFNDMANLRGPDAVLACVRAAQKPEADPEPSKEGSEGDHGYDWPSIKSAAVAVDEPGGFPVDALPESLYHRSRVCSPRTLPRRCFLGSCTPAAVVFR